jgi:hypothetical protein
VRAAGRSSGLSRPRKPDNLDRPKVLGSKADLRLWSRIFDVQVGSRFCRDECLTTIEHKPPLAQFWDHYAPAPARVARSEPRPSEVRRGFFDSEMAAGESFSEGCGGDRGGQAKNAWVDSLVLANGIGQTKLRSGAAPADEPIE